MNENGLLMERLSGKEKNTMVYVFLADGFEEIEALTPVDLLRRAGVEVKTVSIYPDRKNVTGARAIAVMADITIDDVDTGGADILVLPGGMPGTVNLLECQTLMDMVDSQNEQGKRIAAICAAPMALGAVGLLDGRRFTCYPGCEAAIRGGEYTDALPVIADGNILTSRGPGTAIDFGLAIVERIVSREAALRVAKGMLYANFRN